MKLHQGFFILLLILSACSFNEKDKFNGEVVNNFGPAIELEGTRVFENEMGVMYLKRIDSLMVISTMNEPYLQIYDKDQNFIGSLGKEGRGPGEFGQPPMIVDGIQSESGLTIFAYDRPTLTLNSIDLTASIDSNKVIINRKYELPKELTGTGADDIFYVDSTMITGVYDDRFSKQLDEKRGGFYYYPKSGEFETFSLYNLRIEPYEMNPASNLNARITTISPDRNKIASLMVHYPGLEVVHLDSTADPSRYLLADAPPKHTFDLEDFKEDKIMTYYKSIYSTDRHLYLLYAGIQEEDFYNSHETRIQVLDWDANPIREFKIPAKYSLDMVMVDEEDQRFYGWDNTENDAVYKFDYGDVQ
ncbi:TolB-like 6-bladed beta-propeller domain-containing protein [Aliifodinibius salicampi]|uniref:TolB-like 6-bladed beta-propeller domain-containing protein n=1 Tax=Fodinibius salicampi TaxID=1920655 RepID=A0ABT3PWN9_9BACT|nr:hypothetical protein [Fodinibius salicampi]MCW9712269.1 TolB-like 6-bladed beta-propeller domain-containing protein [Fodinibius salicampi]